MSFTKLNVLIVEDDTATRRLLEHAVKTRGHNVAGHESAEQALEELRRNCYSLLIIDLVLPGIDGLELCRRIRESPDGDSCYILVATACNQPDDLQAVLDAGANDYLAKPIDLPLLQVRLSIAEQQLQNLLHGRQIEELHQTILREALDGFIICGPDGRLTEVNETYCQITGFERKELIGMPLAHLMPDYRPESPTETNGSRTETRHRRKDGNWIDIEISTRELGDSDGLRFSFVRDLTERKRVEHTLRYRAQVQELASSLAADFIDAPGQEIDDHINAALARLGEFAGADRCTLLLFSEDGRTMRIAHEYCAPQIPSQMDRHQNLNLTGFPWLQKLVERPTTVNIGAVNSMIELGDAERKALQGNGAKSLIAAPLSFGRTFLGFLALVSTTRDHAFPKENEELLALVSAIFVHSLQRKQAAADMEKLAAFPKYNPNLVLEFTPDGRLSYFNAAARHLSQSLGRVTVRDILPPDTPAVVRKCLSSGEPTVGLESRHGNRTISWSFYPIPAIRAVHCYAVEITDRLSIEEQLRQSQKMESIGQLAAGVAHDFNNVLTVIEGHAGLLLSETELPSSAVESLGQIAAAAGKAANLTRQLLTFSRRQVMQPKMIDLNVVIQNVTRMLDRLLGEDIAIQFNFATRLPKVHADTGMMEQVLLNLAVNARDAMPKGGKLIITTSAVEVDASHALQFTEARPGLFVRLSMADTGTGIEAGHLTRIFEPFFTTKAVGKGTGLGLATVYGILKQHGGWIQVYSEIGRGSTFSAYLPAVQLEETASQTTHRHRDVKGGVERILVVEDEAALRQLAGQILRRFGYQVQTAETGVAALKVWEEAKGEFDLLLTDMVMPEGISGRELAEMLKQKKQSLRVIYSSGYSQEIAGQDLTLEEGFNFLQKPYHPLKLAETVRDCLDR
ncbi:response regulator [bacterium]|nr:response regulator [bacterium]